VLASHDPPALVEAGRTVERRVSGAQLVEIDSDHYLTLREADRVSALLADFLSAASPATSSGR
jgi:hypothetical protein